MTIPAKVQKIIDDVKTLVNVSEVKHSNKAYNLILESDEIVKDYIMLEKSPMTYEWEVSVWDENLGKNIDRDELEGKLEDMGHTLGF